MKLTLKELFGKKCARSISEQVNYADHNFKIGKKCRRKK
jgi:hypothetical protein